MVRLPPIKKAATATGPWVRGRYVCKCLHRSARPTPCSEAAQFRMSVKAAPLQVYMIRFQILPFYKVLP